MALKRESRAVLRNLPFCLASAAIPVGIFAWFFHWQIVIPTNALWMLQGDWGANVIGWNAFRHDEWRWPLASTRLLAWPTGTPIIFTDSNPFVALLLKPFSALLPTPFQFTGLWLFSCIVLQFAVGYALLRHAAEDRRLRVIGATLLTLMPTLINRMGHANLCAHWTILLSLHVYLNVAREERRDLGFGAILLFSALTHPYILLMNASIWGCDVLRRAWPRLRRADVRGLGGLAARSAAVLAGPVAGLWAIGALGGFQGEAGGFGYYSMALDAIFNPAIPGYSRLLPAAPQGEGQVFEGFQYLGAGLLAVLAAGAVAALVSPEARGRLRRMSWLGWLAPGLIVLLALALSSEIQFHGREVASSDYDWLPFNLTSTFRASGRLFWPCAYVLVLVGLELLFALPKAWALGLGAAAVALQAYDLTGFAAAQRKTTAEAAQPQHWQRTSSRKWDALIESAAVVEYQPPNPHLEGKLFYEVAWRATSRGRPVNIMYTARIHPAQRAYESAARGRFLRGQLEPRHLYVVADGCAPAGIDPSRLKLVNQVLVIPPAAARYPFELRQAPPPEPFPLGREVSFAAGSPQARCNLGGDWSGPEDWGVWSNGPAPELVLRLPAPPERDLLLTVTGYPFPPQGQAVTVIAGGRAVARWPLSAEPASYQARIPRELANGTLLHLVLKIDRLTSPSALGLSPDSRLLGLALQSARLDPAP